MHMFYERESCKACRNHVKVARVIECILAIYKINLGFLTSANLSWSLNCRLMRYKMHFGYFHVALGNKIVKLTEIPPYPVVFILTKT